MKDCRPFGVALRGEASNRHMLRQRRRDRRERCGKGARDVSDGDPLAGCGGAPPPAVDPIIRAEYLSCPNDNAVHDRSGHRGGYHNPGWKNAERSGGGRRCLHRLRGQPLDNTVIAIDTRTGAQTVISAEGGTHAVTVDPARHTVVASNTAAGTASVIERR